MTSLDSVSPCVHHRSQWFDNIIQSKHAIILIGLCLFFAGGVKSVSATEAVLLNTETVVQPYLGITPVFGRWNGPIPWVYNPTSASTYFSDTDTMVTLIKEAMAEWEGVSGIQFDYQGVDGALLDSVDDKKVVIFWGSANGAAATAGPSRSVSSSSSVALGYDAYTDGSMEMNNIYDWSNAGQYTTAMMNRSLKSVLVHELGHLLGLGHSDNPSSIMFADPYNDVAHLLADDIAAVQAFYGPSANPNIVATYTPPTAGISPFTANYAYINPANSSSIEDGDTVPVTEIDTNSADFDKLIFRMGYKGPLVQSIELLLVDPSGYLIHETSISLSCQENFSCKSSNEIGAVDILKSIPGQYHVYITSNDQLLVDYLFTVTTTPVWNHPPTATISFSATSGLSPLTVTADLTASDPENNNMTVTWHIPGIGIVNEINFTGQASQTFTFEALGEHSLFVAINDDGARYYGNGRSSPAGTAGVGVQTLLSEVFTVAESITPNPGSEQIFTRNGEALTVTLMGSTSDSSISRYDWTVVSVPTGSTITTDSLNHGDGSVSDINNLDATFQPDQAGVYVLSLTTTTGLGIVSDPSTTRVALYGDPIVLPTTVRAGEAFLSYADLAIDGVTITDYSWNFGDHSDNVSGAGQTHTFSKSGQYIVTMTATTAATDLITYHIPLTVLEAQHTIQGTISGLAAGDSLDLIAISTATGAVGKTTVEGVAQVDDTNVDLSFSIQGLPSANDYRLYLPTSSYVGGYWGGLKDSQPSSPVKYDDAMDIDLSSGDAQNINIQVSKGRTLNITLYGLTLGVTVELTAWSVVSGNLAMMSVMATDTTMTVELSGLSAAADTLLFVQPAKSSSFRAGYYQGDLEIPAGIHRAIKLDLTQVDRSVKVMMGVGRSISGLVNNMLEGESVSIEAWSEKTQQMGSVTVIGNSNYTISGLPAADDYKICVEAATRSGGCYQDLNGVGLVAFPMATKLDLTSDNHTDINIMMNNGRSIQGTISGFSSEEEVWVEAFSASRSHWISTQMMSDGSYLLQGMQKAADYQITVQAYGYITPSKQIANLFEFTSTTVNFTLFKGGRIQGSINGLNAGDYVTVTARSLHTNDDKERVLIAKNSQSLTYLLDGLRDSDDYVVTLQTPHGRFYYNSSSTVRNKDQAENLSIVDAKTVSDIDFDVSAAVSYTIISSISGLGVDHADSIITVTAISLAGELVLAKRAGDGLLKISGLPEGDYHLFVEAPNFITRFYNGSEWTNVFDSAATLSVTADINSLDIPLIVGRSISGTVSHSGTSVVNANITAWDQTQGVGGNSYSGLDGTFQITGLANGSYQVTAQANEGRVVIDEIVVAGADVVDQALVLSKGAGSIRGTTKPGAMLLLYNNSNDEFVTSAVADAGGVYQFSGLELDISYRVDVDTGNDLDNVDAFFSVEATFSVTPKTDNPEITLNLLIGTLVELNTSMGMIIVELDPINAPISVANFLGYLDSDFYDGLIFHRVIANFMVQGGAITADLQVRTSTQDPIKNEADNGLINLRATVAMARTSEVDSATSQFFINLVDNAFLDHGVRDYGYAVFGKVILGMDVVDQIGQVETSSNDIPLTPITIQTATRTQ